MSTASTQSTASTAHETHETLRKALHIAFGLGALSLRWLPWTIAAAVCVVAVIGNWLLLHRLVGKRVARHERGYDAGIVLYPIAVLVLIVVFRDRLAIAAAAWAIMAFGDGFATLAGKNIRGPRLPWNEEKSWSGFVAFLAFGFVGAEVTWMFVAGNAPLNVIAVTVALCAIGESLALNVDDNLIVPLVAGVSFPMLLAMHQVPQPRFDVTWLVVNTVLALLGYAMKSVDVSGLIGGWLLGAIIVVYGGWQLYVVLLAFFVVGTAMTKVGYKRKARRGLAQERGGRRGASHAFSNVGVAAILAIAFAGTNQAMFWYAAIAALATAAADTTASEVGQLIGRRTFLPLTLRTVPVGTEGAISLEGTVAGLVA
jgi:dolichol kinase